MMKIYNPQYAITNKDMSSQILRTCDYIDGGMEEAIQFTMAIITEHTSVYKFFYHGEHLHFRGATLLLSLHLCVIMNHYLSILY